MKDAFFSFLKSKTFKAILAVIAAALTGYASQGCGSPPRPKAADVWECRVAVLAPYVADAAPDVAAAFAGGSINPVQFLLGLGLSPDEIMALAKAYHACQPAEDAGPAPDAAAVEPS